MEKKYISSNLKEKIVTFLLSNKAKIDEEKNEYYRLELAIKQNTVSTFRKNIYNKLGVTTSIGLYKLALKEGIVK